MIFITDKIFHLKSFPLFADLSDAELAAIANICKEKVYKPDETVCQKGSIPQKLFLTLNGGLKFNGDDLKADAFKSLSVFGLTGLLFNLPLEKTCVACPEKGFSCLQIGKSSFFTIIHECPGLLLSYLQSLKRSSGEHYSLPEMI